MLIEKDSEFVNQLTSFDERMMHKLWFHQGRPVCRKVSFVKTHRHLKMATPVSFPRPPDSLCFDLDSKRRTVKRTEKKDQKITRKKSSKILNLLNL